MIRRTYLAAMIANMVEQLHLVVSKFHQSTYRYTDMIDSKDLHRAGSGTSEMDLPEPRHARWLPGVQLIRMGAMMFLFLSKSKGKWHQMEVGIIND